MAAPMKHMSRMGKLVFETSSFKNDKSRHTQVVNDHYLNYSMSIIIPGCDRVPDIITNPLCAEKAYLISQLPLSVLVNKEFIEAFIKRGHVYMLSNGTRIDTDDCAALLPSGHLILHLSKDSYELLGLDGRPSVCGGKKPGKFVVDIDLTQSFFTPGKKNYDRVKVCLEEYCPLVFDFLCVWTPKDIRVCPSSLPNYFEKHGYSFEELNMKQVRKVHRGLEVPVLISQKVEPTLVECGFQDVYDWLGFVTCNCNGSGDPDNYLSSFPVPSPSLKLDTASYRIEGMLSTSTIQNVLDILREYVQSSGSIPWAAMTVHGFSDSPVSWLLREHGYQYSGENLFTFLLFKNEDYWLFYAIDSTDICP